MADEDKQVEIEVALRDTASQTLRIISREIDTITRKLVETGRRGSEAFQKIRDKGGEAGAGGGKAAEGVDKFTKSITSLTKSLAGPLGLAAAFLAVGKSLTNFARHRVELQLLTTDLDVSLKKISEWQQLLSRKGVGEAAAKQFITSMVGQIQDLRMRDSNSDLWRRLTIYDDPKFGEGLKRSAKSGNIAEAFEASIDHVQELLKFGEAGRLRAQYFATQVWGQPLSMFTDWDKFRKELTASYKVNDEEAKRADKERIDLEIKVTNQLTSFTDFVITQINRVMDTMKEEGKEGRGIPGILAPTTPGTPPAPAAPAAPATPGTGNTLQDYRRFFGPGFPATPGKQSSLDDDRLPSGARFVSAENMQTSEPLAKAFAMAFKDVGESEKKSNRALVGIRDTLNDIVKPVGEKPGGGLAEKLASRGPTGSGAAGTETGTGTGASTGGGGTSTGLTDQSGKGVDPVTVGRLQELAARNDMRGMLNLMRTNGYRVDSKWCGDVTRVLVGGSGFPVPKGYPIASKWRSEAVGQVIPWSGVNEPGRSFGSLTASKTNVPIGSLGGHVMTVVPGTYDPKTRTAIFIDTGGRRRRPVAGFEPRWAGEEAERRAAAARAGQPQPQIPAVPPTAARPAPTPVVPNLIRPAPDSTTPPVSVRPVPAPQSGGARPGITLSSGKRLAATPAADTSGWRTGLASWFDDASTATGMPRSVPGIALPDPATKGQWFWVRDNRTGKEVLTQQTDVGPMGWTKKSIDINRPLARQFGYEPGSKRNDFPSGNKKGFSWRPALDREIATGRRERQSSRRDGNVKASVDFGAMQRVKEAGEIFLPTKVASFSQGSTVHRNTSLPGSPDYTRWTG